MKKLSIMVILGSLVLLASCAENPTDLPGVEGYAGYLELGWQAYEDENFQSALDYFLEAIDIIPSRPDAYIGAGWASLFLPDYWRIADQYFYMAIQNQCGYYPLVYSSESQIQDTMWTTFECLHPDLPAGVLNPILACTADSGIVWVSEQIEDIVGEVPMPFRFKPLNNGVNAMFMAVNGYSTEECAVDSIAHGWVYITVPVAVLEVGDEDYYVWINVDDQVNYEYRVFDTSGSPGGQFFYDALAGSCMLQHIRGIENGDALLCCSSAWALDKVNPGYSFGQGFPLYQGLESLNTYQIKGTAASMAFAQQYFKFAWFTCLSKGLGTELDPADASFVTDLMAVIETMMEWTSS